MSENFMTRVSYKASYGRTLHAMGLPLDDVLYAMQKISVGVDIASLQSLPHLVRNPNEYEKIEECFSVARAHYAIFLLAMDVNFYDIHRNGRKLDYNPSYYKENALDFINLVTGLNKISSVTTENTQLSSR